MSVVQGSNDGIQNFTAALHGHQKCVATDHVCEFHYSFVPLLASDVSRPATDKHSAEYIPWSSHVFSTPMGALVGFPLSQEVEVINVHLGLPKSESLCNLRVALMKSVW